MKAMLMQHSYELWKKHEMEEAYTGSSEEMLDWIVTNAENQQLKSLCNVLVLPHIRTLLRCPMA